MSKTNNISALRTLAGVAAVMGSMLISFNAQAITVVNNFTNGPDTDIMCRNNPDPSLVQNCWTAGTRSGHNFIVPNTGNDALLSDDAFGSILGDSTLLYKAESADDKSPGATPAGEEGMLQGSYETSFFFDVLDIKDGYTGATISYQGGPAVDCSHDCFLVIKDGKHNPSAYLFNLALGWDPLGKNGQPTEEGPPSWDGIMDLTLANFWNSTNGSISYLALYGVKKATVVPVPASMWLFGTALLGFIGIARSRRV